MKISKRVFLLLLISTLLVLPACGAKQWSEPPAMSIDKSKEYTATIATNYGNIEVQLFPEEAPLTVNNFVFLSRQGFYNGLKFFRISKGFVIQTGDPMNNGYGGPGYEFEDEEVIRDYLAGTLAMANSGPDTNGSQFFITLADLTNLPKNYTIFGIVTDGFNIVNKIANVSVSRSPSGEWSLPDANVYIKTVSITEK